MGVFALSLSKPLQRALKRVLTHPAALRAGGGYPAPTDPSAIALIARLGAKPSPQRAYHMDQVVKLLKVDPASVGSTIFARMAALWFPSNFSSEAAHIDWTPNARNLVDAGGTVTWIADQALAGDGTASYMTTGVVPSTAGGAITQDSLSAGVLTTAPTQSSSVLLGAASGVFLRVDPCSASSQTAAGIVGNSTVINGPASSGSEPGLVVVSRTGPTAAALYKDGVEIATSVIASTNLQSQQVCLARNGSAYTAEPIVFAFVGSGFVASEIEAIYQAVKYWMIHVVRPIAGMGDSLMFGSKAGALQSAYNPCATMASILGRPVFNGGIGGQESDEILARFMRSRFLRDACTVIMVAGRNYGEFGAFSAPWSAAVKADLATFVSTMLAAGNNRYLIGGVQVGDYAVEYLDGGAQRPVIDGHNDDIVALYGPRSVMPNPPLIAMGSPTGAYPDAVAFGHSVTSSGLRYDALHGGDIGASNPMYQTLGALYAAAITANGL